MIEIHTFSFTKMHFKRSSGKWWPFYLGLNVLIHTLLLNVHKHKMPRYQLPDIYDPFLLAGISLINMALWHE